MSEGSYAGRLAHDGDLDLIDVATARLRPYLTRHVDLLKLNIEGAETAVLEDCADLLKNFERIILEYHSFIEEPQTLDKLISVLSQADFRLYIRSVHDGWPLQPFINIPVHMGMDLQIYIYAF